MNQAAVVIFHGTDKTTHDAFQEWRRNHPDGFHMTESAPGVYTIHWTQDKRENPEGRGCHHQGGSLVTYRSDKGGCYTTARKVCSENLTLLFDWARQNSAQTRRCQHCDTRRFPFPTLDDH